MRQITMMFVVLGAFEVTMLGAGGQQQDAAVTRLQQEVGQLRFQLDLASNRLDREVERLQAQVADLQYAPRSHESRPPTRPILASTADEIEIRRLVVRDTEGRPRIVLSVGDQFGPMVALLDVAGEVDLMLSSPETGPRIERFDDSGQVLDGLTSPRR